MDRTTSVEVDIAGKKLVIEAGLLAQQAAGSVTVTMEDTVLFSAVTCTDKPREGIDYFPLQVEYREKFYAAGRFPGGFFKREARPAEKEILSARITDSGPWAGYGPAGNSRPRCKAGSTSNGSIA